ncbi:MAG: hypothetical protein AAF085_04490 [Planctomycetota bacterium]
MKHVLTLLLICSLTLVGCGEEKKPEKLNTPGEVVEKFAYAWQDADFERIKEFCPALSASVDDEELQQHAAAIADVIINNGGIATVSIEEETVDGESATVIAKLTNGSGLTDTETFNLEQKDGKWVITKWTVGEREIDPNNDFDNLDSDEADTSDDSDEG